MGSNPILLQDPASRQSFRKSPFVINSFPLSCQELLGARGVPGSCFVPPAVVIGTLVKALKWDKIRDSFRLVPPRPALGSALRPR